MYPLGSIVMPASRAQPVGPDPVLAQDRQGVDVKGDARD